MRPDIEGGLGALTRLVLVVLIIAGRRRGSGHTRKRCAPDGTGRRACRMDSGGRDACARNLAVAKVRAWPDVWASRLKATR
jgi:hypothetical protein